MQLFEPAHTRNPFGQAQVPPGDGHTSPDTLQSPFTQQPAVGMHAPAGEHSRCPLGQEQVPPAPEQISPESGQSVLTQQAGPPPPSPVKMHMPLHGRKSVLQRMPQMCVPLQVGMPFCGVGQSLAVQQSPLTHMPWQLR